MQAELEPRPLVMLVFDSFAAHHYIDTIITHRRHIATQVHRPHGRASDRRQDAPLRAHGWKAVRTTGYAAGDGQDWQKVPRVSTSSYAKSRPTFMQDRMRQLQLLRSANPPLPIEQRYHS